MATAHPTPEIHSVEPSTSPHETPALGMGQRALRLLQRPKTEVIEPSISPKLNRLTQRVARLVPERPYASTTKQITGCAQTISRSQRLITQGLQPDAPLGDFDAAQRLVATLQTVGSYGGNQQRDAAVHRARDLASELLAANTEAMTAALQANPSQERINSVLGLYRTALSDSNGERLLTSHADFLLHHCQLAEPQESAEIFEAAIQCLPYDLAHQAKGLTLTKELLASEDPQQVRLGRQYMVRLLSNPIIDASLKDRVRQELATPTLAEFGLNYQELSEAWKLGSGEQGLSNEQENLERILALEQARPGICRTLGEPPFGIKNFGRWPEALLISQYDQLERKGPYGLIVAAAADPISELITLEKPAEELLADLQQAGSMLRVAEAASKPALVRSFFGIGRKYGPMQFRVVVGHGTEDSLRLGGKDNEVLTTRDLTTLKNNGTLSRYSEPGCENVIISCLTGAEGGIVQAASARFPEQVLDAPDQSARLISLRAKPKANGGLHIEVEFGKGRDRKPVTKVRYLGGKAIQKTTQHSRA